MGEQVSERESLAMVMHGLYCESPRDHKRPSTDDLRHADAALAWFAEHQPARVVPSAEAIRKAITEADDEFDRLAPDAEADWGDWEARAVLALYASQPTAGADEGLLAESAPVAGGNGAVSAEQSHPRPTPPVTPDSLTARLVAARAATDGYRAEAERLRELLDEAHAKIERMEEL